LVVDKHGQLYVFWVRGGGQWQGPNKIGPTGFRAPPGANLAVSQQFGAFEQTNAFVVDTQGQLQVFWIQGGDWTGPQSIGKSGFTQPGAAMAATQQFGALNQTDVALFDSNGLLNVFFVQNNGGWQGPVQISPTGFAPPGAPLGASQQFGADNQTDLFTINNAGQVGVFFVQSGNPWGGPVSP
jgi:hypothetical protein